LGQNEPGTRFHAALGQDLLRMDESGHRQAVFELAVFDAVPAGQRDASLLHFIEAAREYLPQDGKVHLLDRKADQVHGGFRFSPQWRRCLSARWPTRSDRTSKDRLRSA
jgi:hypothetical protein